MGVARTGRSRGGRFEGARADPSRGGRFDDCGSAVIEFVALGLLMLLPLIYLVIALGRIQAAGFAADGSAREAARAYVTADSDADGARRADDAVRLGVTDQGFAVGAARLDVACRHEPCLTPGSRVVATVSVRVVLPGVPTFVDRVVPAAVIVRASQVEAVDEFRPIAGPP